MKMIFHEDFYRVYTADPAAEEGRMEAVVDVVGPHVEFVTALPASLEDIEAVHTRDTSITSGARVSTNRKPCRGRGDPGGDDRLSEPAGLSGPGPPCPVGLRGGCYATTCCGLTHLKNRGMIETALCRISTFTGDT